MTLANVAHIVELGLAVVQYLCYNLPLQLLRVGYIK